MYRRKDVRVKDKARLLITLLGPVAVSEVPALLILYLINSKLPVYLGSIQYSLYPQIFLVKCLLQLIFAIWELLLIITLVINLYFYASISIAWAATASFWLQEMR